jgi:hypothetical protein
MRRRYAVVCEWTDTRDESVLDADEIQVFAENAEEAARSARRQWRLTIGADWPSCRLERIWISTPARRRSLV